MKKKLFTIFAAMTLMHVVVFSQSADFYGVVHIGGNLPVGNFSKATVNNGVVEKWGLADESSYGGAGIGTYAGLLGAKRIGGIEELSVFVSLDFFFNPLNKTLRDHKEQYEVDNINTHDKYEQSFPVYFNIPMFAGCRYDFYTSNRNISIFSQLGIGADFRIITDYSIYWNMYKQSSAAYRYMEEYRNKVAFAAMAGAGAIFFDRIQVGLQYHYLGTSRVISDSETIINEENGSSKTIPMANSRGRLTPHLISLTVGYVF